MLGEYKLLGLGWWESRRWVGLLVVCVLQMNNNWHSIRGCVAQRLHSGTQYLESMILQIFILLLIVQISDHVWIPNSQMGVFRINVSVLLICLLTAVLASLTTVFAVKNDATCGENNAFTKQYLSSEWF